MKIATLVLVSGLAGSALSTAQSWVDLTSKVPSGPKSGGANSIASTGTALYVISNNGILRSKDNGNTWSAVNNVAGKSYKLNEFGTRCLEATGTTLWAGGEPGSLALTGGVLPLHRLGPASISWAPSFTGAPQPLAIDTIAFDSFKNTYWCAGRLGSIYKSTDGGKTWADARGDLPGTNIASIVARNGRVIATVQGIGVFTSTDGGKTWRDRGAPLISVGTLASVGNQVVVTGSGNTTLTSGAYVSKDFGLTWVLKQNFMNGSMILEKSCADTTTIFAGGMVTTFTPSFQAIFTPTVAWSKDGGSNWKKITAPGLPTGNGVACLERHGNFLFALLADFNGVPRLFRLDVSSLGGGKAPEIAVQQPAGANLTDGKSPRNFGPVKVGRTGIAKTFTIRNTGKGTLSNIGVSISGAHAADFVLNRPLKTSLAPGASTTFKVSFKPRAKNLRSALVKIRSNDANENPFDIPISGTGS